MIEPILTSPASLRVFVVGNTKNAIARAALCGLLNTQPDFEVIGDGGHSDDIVPLVSQLHPDIVVFDVSDFDEALQTLLLALFEADAEHRVVLLTSSPKFELLKMAIDCGVVGIVQQNQGVDMFFKALRCVYAGEIWIERTVVTSLLRESKRPQPPNWDDPNWRIGTLTKQEHDVIALVCQGLKNQAIATALFLSEATVRHRLTAIFEKLQVAGRVELVILAHHYDLFQYASRDSLSSSSDNPPNVKRPRARK